MWDESTDLALAIQLQNELNDETTSPICVTEDETHRKPESLVDPIWELIDPNPDARDLFLQFNQRYFWGKLSAVEVRWSPRMTLCAGVCVYEGMGGLCSVRLSLPLLKLRPRKDLVETLLHEMIHAYLFVTDNNKDHDGHGPEFHKHMYRINADSGTNITVYHTFHDEVENYRQHWWKCDGPCQKKPPYFGCVKRAMNRAPSARDPWWNGHKETCGGTYSKVKEPEGYGQKKSKKKEAGSSKAKPETSVKTPDIRNLFSGKNNKNSSPNSSEKPKLPSLPAAKSSNIAGFVKGANKDELDVYRDSPVLGSEKQVFNPFPGKGKSLATASNWVKSPPGSSHIVRKLPGFGVIETTRPKEKPVVSTCSKDDSDDDILIYSPLAKLKNSKPTNNKGSGSKDSSKTDIRSWVTKKTSPSAIVLNLSDSDSEFDALLSKASLHKKTSPNNQSSVSTPKGMKHIDSPMNKKQHKVSPSGFQSVCRKTGEESKRHVETKVYEIRDENSPPGKSKGFTAQRNKRAHDLGSSSSDSDIDAKEKLSLLSVMKRKRKKSMGSENDRLNTVNSAHKSQVHSNASSVCDEIPSRVQPSSSFIASGSKISSTSKITNPASEGAKTPNKGSECSTFQSPVASNGMGSVAKTTISEPSEDLLPCPVCSTLVKSGQINEHLDACLS